MRVVVLGAGGQLGGEIVRELSGRGHGVTGFMRRLQAPGLDKETEIRIGDARKWEDLIVALRGHDVVVNAIGSGTLRKNNVESSTTAVAVGATQDVGISRYIAMSAGMVAIKSPIFNSFIRPLIFGNLYAEHNRVERTVMASQLAWTVVRPPRLTNGPTKGYKASSTLQPRSYSMARADVATFIADEIDENAYVRKAVFLS